MFGNSTNDQPNQINSVPLPAQPISQVGPITPTTIPETTLPPPASATQSEPPLITPSAPAMPSVPDPGDLSSPTSLPVMPAQPTTAEPPTITPLPAKPSVNLENAYIPTAPTGTTNEDPKPTAASLVDNANGDDLIKIKQQALQNLAPLIDKLDQSPEERFRTTMMLIQATDNADLVKDAYEAANEIKDEKARAQALLDVVNETNYFTHHQEQEKEA